MRLEIVTSLAEQVRRGLADPSQKWLPAAAFYDDVGTALFEAITALPEYGLTRADLRLLTAHSHAIASASGAARIIELGSGSGVKTRRLLSAFPLETVYTPVDVSRAALERCAAELSGFVVLPVQDEFLPGLRSALIQRDDTPVLVAFLGSNIGNFERDAIVPFLRDIRQTLRPGDAFLLGADLVKPVDQLLLAYDDPVGVTAAFNRNLLARLNRDFGGDFDPRAFEHETRWEAQTRCVEMHLRAGSRQHARLRELELDVILQGGETIWTESSHKFEVGELTAMAAAASFGTLAVWMDREWPFAEFLFRSV